MSSSGRRLAANFSTVGDALVPDDSGDLYDTDETLAARAALIATQPDADILLVKWRDDDPEFRVCVFEHLIRRGVVEPRRAALTAMREGFQMVPFVARSIQVTFASPDLLKRFVSGDAQLDSRKIWSLLTFDALKYYQLQHEANFEIVGPYTEDDAPIQFLRNTLDTFTPQQLNKFFKFVTGLDAIPVCVPEHKDRAFTLFVDGKSLDKLDRLPTSSTCYRILHLPPYQTQGTLRDKLLLATENATGFGSK